MTPTQHFDQRAPGLDSTVSPTLIVQREQGTPHDPDTCAAEIVRSMQAHIARSACDPAIQSIAGNLPGESKFDQACSVFWWVKSHLTFQSDDPEIARLFGERDQLELLISPEVMVRLSRPAGDCDDYTMLVCALLTVLGIGYEIVTVAADPTDVARFSHVYCQAVIEDGDRLTLDASHGGYPGWEVPADHITRKRVWERSQNPAFLLSTMPVNDGYKSFAGYAPGRWTPFAPGGAGMGAYMPDPATSVAPAEPHSFSWLGLTAFGLIAFFALKRKF